jgi:hypothetical protein
MTEDKLYAVAMQCARLNSNGCANGCVIESFSAYTDYYNNAQLLLQFQEQRAVEKKGKLIIIAAIITGLFLFFRSCGLIGAEELPYPGNLNGPAVIVTSDAEDIRYCDLHVAARDGGYMSIELIPSITASIRWFGIADMNNDGLQDSLDAALMFYIAWGRNCSIIKYSKDGYEHYYVRVGSINVEPLAYPLRSYRLEDIWGTIIDYDPRYHRYVTGQVVAEMNRYYRELKAQGLVE